MQDLTKDNQNGTNGQDEIGQIKETCMLMQGPRFVRNLLTVVIWPRVGSVPCSWIVLVLSCLVMCTGQHSNGVKWSGMGRTV